MQDSSTLNSSYPFSESSEYVVQTSVETNAVSRPFPLRQTTNDTIETDLGTKSTDATEGKELQKSILIVSVFQFPVLILLLTWQ